MVMNFHDVFQNAPVSLWIEDYSAVRALLDALRQQGVTDFEAHLEAHPYVLGQAMARIVVVEVNATTLKLFKAESQDALLANLHRVFRDDMSRHFAYELKRMWDGQVDIEIEGINYALDGMPVQVLLRRSLLPGHEQDWSRVLISITDITERKRAMERLAASELHAQGLFEHSPVSLWLEDYSALRSYLEGLRAQGITNIRRHLVEHPEVVLESMQRIRVVDVNQQTLELFGAASKTALIDNLHRVFRDEARRHFEAELVDLWDGKITAEYEGINYALHGEPVDILLRRTALPGSERSWQRVLVAISDITARKKAESYMQYLGTHDVLTGLKNRAFYEDALHRLQAEQRVPVSVLVLDLNGLKPINDAQGHEAGDQLLRRAAEVLLKAAGANDVVARIGGDEFAMLLPYQDERAAQQVHNRILHMAEVDNQFYTGARLSYAVGRATAYAGMALEQAHRAADQQMYRAKQAFYAAS